MASEELTRFIDDMITKNNLTSLSGEMRDKLVADLAERLNDQINRAIIEAMSDQKTDEFTELLENPDTTDESLQRFVQESGVDVRQVTAKTMVRFYDLYVTKPNNTGQ